MRAPKPGVTLHTVEAAMDGVLDDVIEHGITADELDRAKTGLIADAVYAQDNQATLARWYGAGLTTGQTVAEVGGWPDRVRAVTAAQVQEAARQWLDIRRSVTGYLVKKPARRGESLVNALGRALSLIARKQETARLAQCAGAVAIALTLSAAPASATNIERIVSPGGIVAWLVHETAVPLITVDFAFDGGGAQDPAGKAGTANLMASLLDEGAGDLDANAFAERLDRKAVQMHIRAARDHIRGTLQTLSENRDEAFDDLRLALTEPRFDAAAVELNREQLLSGLRRQLKSPTDLAALRWWSTAYSGHILWPAGRRHAGIGVRNITIDDLKAYQHRVLARDNLTVAIVGDIDAEAAKAMLDRVFGALPAKAELVPIENVAAAGTGQRINHRSRCAADRDRFRRRRHRAQRSGFLGRLHRQPHSRRRLVLLAALPAKCARSAAWPIRCPTAWCGSTTPHCSSAYGHARRPAPTRPST